LCSATKNYTINTPKGVISLFKIKVGGGKRGEIWEEKTGGGKILGGA
jgi:hypothetical protein